MIRVISSFADGPVNFHSTGPPEDQIQKLISSTGGIVGRGNTPVFYPPKQAQMTENTTTRIIE